MDLNVLSAGACKGLVDALGGEFGAATGAGIHASFGAVGAIRERALAGEPCDVIILTSAMIEELAVSGSVLPESVSVLGRVRTAIAVRELDARPDISDADTLRELMLGASAVYVPDVERSTAGIHFMKVLRTLGIEQRVAPQLRPFPSGAVAMRELALSAEAGAVGCTQVTEIRYTPGVALVGFLPREFELATAYAAAVFSKAHPIELALRFTRILGGDRARELRLAGGFED